MRAFDAYQELIVRARHDAILTSCAALLEWDELTYMPQGGVEYRGEQLAFLAGLQHERSIDRRIGELLVVVENSDLVADAHSAASVNVREIRRAYDRMTRLPRQLVEELARVTSVAQQEWAESRRDDDFDRFLPWLEKIVALKIEEAQLLRRHNKSYDALLDEYEPGCASEAIEPIFEALRKELQPLADAIATSDHRSRSLILHREFPLDRQKQLGEAVAAAIGFDFQRGRLDTTVHPFFSSVGPADCRITTRYQVNDFNDAFFGILHEVGHGLYEQGLDPAHYGTPAGEACSVGMHESQARLWENWVGRSRPFWEHFLPYARQLFPGSFHDVTLNQFYGAVNQVGPSLIRIQADEVTYNLHILVRFHLEHDLIEQKLRASDLPAAWDEQYRKYLGVAPHNNADGCLQDGHWASGLFGYFPTYTLGNLYAAQLFARAQCDLSDWQHQFRHGEFTPLLDWLRKNVYCQGRLYSACELLERISGSKPSHAALVLELRNKFTELYGL